MTFGKLQQGKCFIRFFNITSFLASEKYVKSYREFWALR